MPDYKLCFLNAAGERIAAADFHATDDEQARDLGADAVGQNRAQLFRGPELVAEFPQPQKLRSGARH